MSGEIFHCLKRERDICIQTIIPSKNMAFVLTPALTGFLPGLGFEGFDGFDDKVASPYHTRLYFVSYFRWLTTHVFDI